MLLDMPLIYLFAKKVSRFDHQLILTKNLLFSDEEFLESEEEQQEEENKEGEGEAEREFHFCLFAPKIDATEAGPNFGTGSWSSQL